MEEEELEEIRKRKLQQLQEKLREQQQEQAEVQRQILALENFVKQKFTKDALARFGNLKTGHPELAIQVLVVLGEAVKSGKVDVIDDELLKAVLQEMQAGKKETRIIRK